MQEKTMLDLFTSHQPHELVGRYSQHFKKSWKEGRKDRPREISVLE